LLPEGVLNPATETSAARLRGGLCYYLLLGERSESLSGEAPAALLPEGVLNPNNSEPH